MNRTLEKNPFKKLRPYGKTYNSRLSQVSSFEEIPDFDDPIAETRFWKSHRVGKELLDQVPEIEESEN